MSTPATVLVALVAGGAGAALAAVLLLAPTPTETSAPVALVSENAALRRRIDALEQRFDAFSDQVASWKADVAPVEPLAFDPAPLVDVDDAGATSPADVSAAEDVTAESPALDGSAPTPALRDEVAAALEQIRRDEKIAGLRKGLDAKRERLDASMDYLTDKLELNDYQSTELRRAIDEQYDREDALIGMVERGVADDLVGQRKTSDVGMFTDALASFLSDEQSAAFWEIVKNGG